MSLAPSRLHSVRWYLFSANGSFHISLGQPRKLSGLKVRFNAPMNRAFSAYALHRWSSLGAAQG